MLQVHTDGRTSRTVFVTVLTRPVGYWGTAASFAKTFTPRGEFRTAFRGILIRIQWRQLPANSIASRGGVFLSPPQITSVNDKRLPEEG